MDPAPPDPATRRVPVNVERHPDGFVAYPLGLRGVVIGQGDTFEEALADVTSAIRFGIETFGPRIIEEDEPSARGWYVGHRLASHREARREGPPPDEHGRTDSTCGPIFSIDVSCSPMH